MLQTEGGSLNASHSSLGLAFRLIDDPSQLARPSGALSSCWVFDAPAPESDLSVHCLWEGDVGRWRPADLPRPANPDTFDYTRNTFSSRVDEGEDV